MSNPIFHNCDLIGRIDRPLDALKDYLHLRILDSHWELLKHSRLLSNHQTWALFEITRVKLFERGHNVCTDFGRAIGQVPVPVVAEVGPCGRQRLATCLICALYDVRIMLGSLHLNKCICL